MVTVVAAVDDPDPTRGTKTLEAYLVTPTAHKQRRLDQSLESYTTLLKRSFDAGCTTRSAVNDIVSGENLNWQSKDALKNYVPHLLDEDVYGARALADDHPIRYTNRAASFDIDHQRHHSICWEVPQPGAHSNNFWVPLQVNPAQEADWHALLDEEGDVEPGELRLQRDGSRWVLHVTVKYPTEDATNLPDEPTYIGLDIGETALITGCALKGGSPTRPFVRSGRRAKHLRKEMYTTLKRLQERDAGWRIRERFDTYQTRLTDELEKATTEAVEYVREFETPVIVLEDLTSIRESLNYGRFMNRRLHAWAFAQLQTRITQKAKDAGIPVVYVNAAYTSQTCHACRRIGSRRRQAEFVCPYDDCHITEFQADINGAANVAHRADPWGESLPWKPAGDDSPRDGSACDSTTRRTQDRDAKGVATPIAARRGVCDNAVSSPPSEEAGTRQTTLCERDPERDREAVSKPHSGPDP